MKKSFLLIILLYSMFNSNIAKADVKLPSMLSNNMVLQQNTLIKFWGWADKHENIKIKASWLNKEMNTTADEDGKWLVYITTTNAGGPYTIDIEGKNKIKLTNVLLGEVWVCSGQSNMEFTINAMGGWKKYPKEMEEIVHNDYSTIRLCQIEKETSDIPMEDCNVHWMIADTATLNYFSAVAWFFGKELSDKLKVPIALISSNWGGTPAEAWTEHSFLSNDKLLSSYLSKISDNENSPNKHSVLYNAMINPIINYTIKGGIWYQGEANVKEAGLYNHLFPAMIKSWRKAWNIGDFPFYYVQLAPFDYDNGNKTSAYLREAQLKTLSLPNTGMAVTLDIGNVKDIHPKNKQDVGKRLSLWALNKTYRQQDVKVYSGPLFKKMKIENNKIRLYFDNAASGLMAKNHGLWGFEIAGKDLIFEQANAVIEGSEIVVANKTIGKPVAVRYAFTDTASATLFNKEGLPASSFRTDQSAFLYKEIRFEKITDTISGEFFVKITGNNEKTTIRYTIDEIEPGIKSNIYVNPIPLQKSMTIKAKAFEGNTPAVNMASLSFNKHNGQNKKLVYTTLFSQKYKASENSLQDGLHGSTKFQDGLWQGFLGDDVIVTYDLKTMQHVNKVVVSFLQDINSWIFAPLYVDIYVSDNDKDYRLLKTLNNDTELAKEGSFIKQFSIELDNIETRFIRISAKNIGLCPNWHSGANEKAWVFIDEVELY